MSYEVSPVGIGVGMEVDVRTEIRLRLVVVLSFVHWHDILFVVMVANPCDIPLWFFMSLRLTSTGRLVTYSSI